MRIAEVDNSGYLRARRVGELAYKNSARLQFQNATLTSDVFTLAAGEGKAVSIDYPTPEGYNFNGVYSVTSNHSIACSIGQFSRNGSTGKCWVTLTNRNQSTGLDDCTVSMGVSFVRVVTE